MKSYNHLWETFISEDNIRLAICNSSKGKKKRKDVIQIVENPDKYISIIREYAENFKNKKHNPVEIYDGISRKKRIIIVPTYMEQIIHHMAVQTMLPIFWHGMYEHSYGSIPGRGAHLGKKTIQKWLNRDPDNTKYCLKMDIRKFFDSIPQHVLIWKLEDIIHDQKFLSILVEIISAVEKGIPLGFYISQWLANWYLQGLDHYIKEILGAKYYIRYMDDMVIFGDDKEKLHSMWWGVEDYLSRKLGLHLKRNWQIFRFDYVKKGKHYGRDLDFMGFRFFQRKTILRKQIMMKATRKARRLSKKKQYSIYECRQMLSYFGWINSADTYGMYQKHIKPFVNVRYMKQRIGRYDRRKNEEQQSLCISERNGACTGNDGRTT